MTNWFNLYFDPTQFGSYPDREGKFPNPDVNFSAPKGTAFTAPVSGTITGIDTTSAWGPVITVQMDSAYNSVATHFAFLHLTSIPSNLSVGEHVAAGTILGYGGGGLSNSGALPGFALTASNQYGYGNGWSDNVIGTWINPLLNPNNFLNSLRSGTLENSYQQSGGGSSGKGIFSLLGQNFGPTSGQLQQFMLVVFAGLLILIGIAIIFFNTNAGKKTVQVGEMAAMA